MWRETTKHERNLRIWREELESFVPEKILDFHVHILNAGVMPPGETFSCAGHPIAGYDLDDLAADLAELYPGRETRAVCFGLPDPRYDAGRNNAYLAERCRGARFFALRLFDPVGDTPAALEADLRSGAFLGIKPYPDYVRKADINAVEIPEMLPDWAMEIVDAYGALVMLHIPRKARLADPLNQRQIVELAASRRRARIVLAHIRRAYYLKCVLGNLGAIAPLPNVYVDLAMLNNCRFPGSSRSATSAANRSSRPSPTRNCAEFARRPSAAGSAGISCGVFFTKTACPWRIESVAERWASPEAAWQAGGAAAPRRIR